MQKVFDFLTKPKYNSKIGTRIKIMNKFGAKTLSIARYHSYTVITLTNIIMFGTILSMLAH
jgi:hypothetical protein